MDYEISQKNVKNVQPNQNTRQPLLEIMQQFETLSIQPLVNEQHLQQNQDNPQLQEELDRFKEIQKNHQQLLQKLREMEQLKAQVAAITPVQDTTDIKTEIGNEKKDEMNIIVTPNNKNIQETDAGIETRIFSLSDMNIVGTTTSEKKQFLCHLCGNGFFNKCSMNQHIQVHNGRRFICDVGNCYSFYTTRQNLKLHKLIHTGEKPYSCNVCKRSFRQKKSLSDHLKIHTGEKPYSCKICNRSLRTKQALSEHLKIHTGEKPFRCNLCHRSFRQKNHLSRHMKVHNFEGSNTYSCAVCQKSFLYKNTLQLHLETHAVSTSGQESTEGSNVTGMVKMEGSTPNI